MQEKLKKQPWLQYTTLLMATLSLAFSIIAVFHPFGLGATQTANNTNMPSNSTNSNFGGGFQGGPGGNSSSSSSSSSSSTDDGTTS